jgi:hypothetical protein
MPRGTSLHCKGNFTDNGLDVDEFRRCLTIVKEAGFNGYIALVYDKYDDEWEKVLTLKAAVEGFLGEAGMVN